MRQRRVMGSSLVVLLALAGWVGAFQQSTKPSGKPDQDVRDSKQTSGNQGPENPRETTYDLRGPAPRKGLAFQTSTTLKIKDADTTLKVMGQSLNMKMSMTMISDEEQKILEVKGRDIIKSQAHIRKERAIIKSDFGGGMEITQPTELEGQTVISELVGKGKWKHSLVDTQPTEKQKRELDNRTGIENDDDLFPAEKVPVGHQWEVSADALRKLFGNAIVDVSGKVKQKFVKVEMVEGEECAVIESKGMIRGKMKNEDGEPTIDVEMELHATSWRSLRTAVEVKGEFRGTIKLSGTQKVDDVEVKIEMNGPFSGESRTKVLRAE